jgi:LPS export ABC transporter protein LptC
MKTQLKQNLIFVLLALALSGVAGCSSGDGTLRNTATPTDSILKPDTEVKGAKIDLFDKSQKTTEILAKRILKFEAKDSTMGYDVTAHFFDTLGHVTSDLVGDSALIRETTSHLYVFGHVVVKSEDSTRLETDYLHWNPDIKKIQTDAFVKVYRHGDVATGWGMEANQNLTRVKILNQVSGTIKNTDSFEPTTGK